MQGFRLEDGTPVKLRRARTISSADAHTGDTVDFEVLEDVLDVASTPPGADIEIDGKFVGSTPSSVNVAPGDHDVVVKKSGFAVWDRKITVSSGKINISAELAPEAK